MRWGFELLVFAVGALAAYDAWRSEPRWRAALAGAFVYALAFEWVVTTQATGGFAYGSFAVHAPGGAPLWVPIGWASLVYAAMRTSERLGASGARAVATVASLVAVVGFLLDPVAIALGWWSWSSPGDEVALGAPVGNFLAWLLVGGAYSAATRALARGRDRGRGISMWPAAALAIPIALAAVGAISAAASWVGATRAWLVLGALAGAGAVVTLARARPSSPARPAIVAIPALTTLGVVAVAIVEGGFADAAHAAATLTAGAAVTLPHLRHARGAPATERRSSGRTR